MSTADNRVHWICPVAALALVACGPSDTPPSPCPTLTAALTAERATTGRPLLARVDTLLDETRTTCGDRLGAARGSWPASQLARARLLEPTNQPASAVAELTTVSEPAVALLRAELLDRQGDPRAARAALVLALARAPDTDALTLLRGLDIAIAAQDHDVAALIRVLDAAPVPERPRLAARAVHAVEPPRIPELVVKHLELATAAGDRLEQLSGPAAALAARTIATELAPDDADAWDALARSLIAASRIDDALAAWDRASTLAPAQEVFRTTPIRALVIAGQRPRALDRATTLAAEARASRNVERMLAASAAASAIDAGLALALARDAAAARPGDGRIAFLVAQRFAEAGDRSSAARAYADLLVCGAHGRAWHRHEIAGRLQQLGGDAIAALESVRTCEAVEQADLAPYLTVLRGDR